MKKKFRLLFSVFICLLFSSMLYAGPYQTCTSITSEVLPTYGPVSYSSSTPENRPSGSFTAGELFSGSASLQGRFTFSASDCPLTLSGASVWVEGSGGYSPLETLLYDGRWVWPTHIPGLGFTFYSKDPNFGARNLAVAPGNKMYENQGLSSSFALGVEYYISLVTTGETIPAGQHVIPSLNLAKACVSSGTGSTQNRYEYCHDINTQAINLTVTAPTCEVKTTQVNMPSVKKANFLGIGTEPTASSNFNITLTCAAGIRLMATMSDAISPGNRSDSLTIKNESGSARGVGIKIYRADLSAISYGPESAVAGNTNQFLIDNNTSAGSFDLPLTAKYVQINPTVEPGIVSGMATITLSYQ